MIVSIEKVRAAYAHAVALGKDHDAACLAAAQAVGISVELVREAVVDSKAGEPA